MFFTSVIATVIGGHAADYIDPKYILTFLSLCPLLVTISAISIKEEPDTTVYSCQSSCVELYSHLKLLFSSFTNRKVLRIVLFVVL